MRKLPPITALASSVVAIGLIFSAAQVALAATDTWSTTPAGVNWNSTDWTGGNAPPQAGDALAFGSSSSTTLNNNFPAGTAFDGIYFNGANAFTLNANGVLLSGAISNTVGVLNTSGLGQTFGTLPLSLDWGYYTFSSPSGGTIALNGGLTATPGGLAYFDPNITSLSLVNDGSGLISTLGGAGLTFSGTAFTGLAAISGSTVGTYSGWPSIVSAPGSIGATTAASAVNVEIVGTGAGNYPFANNPNITYANTIFLSTAAGGPLVLGNTAGAQTLDLGAVSGIGGIYVPVATTVQAATIGSGASTILTAGPETGSPTPGTIVFGVNGTATGASVLNAINNSTIKDNLSGGAVTVVKTGVGSMSSGSTLANTYTGGTYIDQGEYRGDNASSFGSGPIHIAANATAYLFSSVTAFANEIYLSPGVGAPSAPTANGGGLIWGGTANNSVNLSGKIHLLGNPVTTGPGNRVSTQSTSTTLTLSGQITGTGTLEFFGGAHSGNDVLANAAQNNNWTGGLIIDPRSTLSIFFKLGANNQIPNGPGTGDFTIIAGSTGDCRFDLNGFSTTINALNAPSTGTVAKQELDNLSSPNLPSTLTMGASGTNGTFFGITADGAVNTLSLVKIGSGTQTFNGAAAFGYHGNTTVSNGTFALAGNGQIPNSPVITVVAGATLDGSALSAGGLSFGNTQTLNCLGTVAGSTTINGTVESFPIGTLANTGNLTLSGGATNNWFINKATNATAGADPGWSVMNVSGTLQINATDGSPFTINVNSLNLSDAPGNAASFSSSTSYSWVIAQAGSISGYTDPGQFNIVTTGFSNFPGSPAQWSVTQSGNNLVLNFTASQVITGPLATPVVVNQGHNATFTVTANPLGTGTSFAWTQNGNPLSNGGTSAGGGNVIINTAGNTSTLTINGVDNAGPGGDGSTIAVGVTTTLSSSLQSANSTATLTVIDTPFFPVVNESGAFANLTLGGFGAGARTYFSASASGTAPFTYQWYLGTNAISGATNATLGVNIAAATAGSYTVVISNSAGSATSSPTSIGPVTSVPGQIIFEPFDSYTEVLPFVQGSTLDTFSSVKGITNLFNQLTGEPSYWTVVGSTGNTDILPNGLGSGSENQFGGTYPVPGLAGDSPNEMYWTTTTVNNHLRITTNGSSLFAVGGPNTNIFFSFSMSVVSLGGGANDGDQNVFGGFSTGAGPSACGLEFWTWDISGGASAMHVGVGKGNGTISGNPTTNNGTGAPLPNVLWGPANSSPLGSDVWTQQSIFVVGCYNVVDGLGGFNDTVTLWIDPPASSYYAQTPPAPYLGPTSFGGTVANSVPQDFVLLNDFAPASHRITDLRIGTTWASVTPPSAPTLLMGNVYAPLGTTAVFTSQNAGNPTQNYGWQFNGGSALSDGPTGHGSTITGSLTSSLTISNVQASDYGLYTVNATNLDVATNNAGNPLTGSTTAILSSQPPKLSVVHSAPNVTVLWPTNWLGYVLEQSPSVLPTSWATNSLPPYAVSGTNNAVTVPVSGGPQYFRLINP